MKLNIFFYYCVIFVLFFDVAYALVEGIYCGNENCYDGRCEYFSFK